jgi:hypothetical protein
MVVDSKNVYWTVMIPGLGGTEAVLKVALGGGPVTELVSGRRGTPSPAALAVNASGVFWVESVTMDPPYTSSLLKVALDGGAVVTLASSLVTQGQFWSVVATPTTVYFDTFGTPGAVMQVPVNGGTATQFAAAVEPAIVVADSMNVYWTQAGKATVMKQAQGSSRAVALDTTLAKAIVLNAKSLYWWEENSAPDGGSVIKSAPAAGGPALSSGSGVAIDSTYAYLGSSNGANSAIVREPLAGGPQDVLVADAGPVADIAVDETSIYWMVSVATGKNVPETQILRLAK